MQDSNSPLKFTVVWASGAGGSYVRVVPVASQIPFTPGAASFTDGFPPLNFVPEASGGVPPFGADENGILKAITAWLQWYQGGAPIFYDATFSAAIGGYPKGALLTAAVGGANWWLSTVENNVTNPDASGAGWLAIAPGLTQAQGDARYGQVGAVNEWLLAQWGPEIAVAYGSTITLNLAAGNNFGIGSITGNFTLANPTNIPAGVQSGQIRCPQNSAGGHVITAFGNKFVGINGNKPNLTAGANGQDLLFYTVLGASGLILLTGANSLS